VPDNKIELILEAISKGFPQLSKQVDGIRKDLTGVKSETAAVQGGVGSLVKTFTGLAGVTIILHEIKKAIKETLGFLGQMETSALGIASAYMIGGQYIDKTTGKALEAERALAAAQEDAKSMLEELQVANFQTIATLDQLVRAYQETLPVAIAQGFDKRQAKEFTVAMVQAAGALGISLDMLAEETRSILTGIINPRTSRIATVLGWTSEDVRRMKGDARGFFSVLMEGLKPYRIAGIESQKTWKGLWSNIYDIALQVGGLSFKPLFDEIKAELSDLASGIVTINEETQKIEWNKDFLKDIETFRDTITEIIAEVRRLAMLLDRIGGTLTAIGFLATGFNKNVWRGINYTFFLGQFKGLEDMAQYQGDLQTWFDDKNKMYEGRYMAQDKALTDQAMRREGFKPATSDQLAMLDLTTAEAAGLTRIVSELGQVLYYYKEINKEKADYKTNPKKQTEEQTKAIETWQKKLRDLQADIEKTLPGTDAAADKIIEIKQKFTDLMKEHGVKLDTSLLDQWKNAMIGQAEWEKQWKQYEELQKKREEGEKRYAALVDDLETSTANEQENRIKKSIQDETKLTKELVTIWATTPMSYKEYLERLKQIEEKGAKERLKINTEFNLARVEADASHQLAALNDAEKNMTTSKEDVIRGRIAAQTTLLDVYNAELQRAIENNDTLARIEWGKKIDETNAALTEQNILLREQTGTFTGGLIQGIKEYAYEMKTAFQYGKQAVMETASALKDSFKAAFADVRAGTFDLQDTFINLCDNISAKFEDMLAEMLTNWIMTGNTMKASGLGGSSGGSGGILGTVIGLLGSLGGGGNTSDYPTDWSGYVGSAKGNAFSTPGLKPYLNSVVMKPTLFKFAHGIGLMGEGAGPGEAIMPLTRTSSGDLGVRTTGGAMKVTVNVINQTGVEQEAEQKEGYWNGAEYIIDVVTRKAVASPAFRNTLQKGKP